MSKRDCVLCERELESERDVFDISQDFDRARDILYRT